MAFKQLPELPATQRQVEELTRLLYEATRVKLVGIYLHGSLAMHCFNPQGSDIDLLAITQQPVTAGERSQILAGLLALSGAPHPVEISIVHYAQINPWRHPAPFDLHFSEAWRARASAALVQGDTTAFAGDGDPDLAGHFTVLIRRGIWLAGTPIEDLQLMVPWADYLDALRSDFAWAVATACVSDVYVILNACRSWAAVVEGSVLSKAEGSTWAAQHVPARFRELVLRASAAYASELPSTPFDPAAVRDFQRWVGERIGW